MKMFVNPNVNPNEAKDIENSNTGSNTKSLFFCFRKLTIGMLPIFLSVFFFLFSVLLCSNHAIAKNKQINAYRNLWHPLYRGELLNYCTMDGKECGLPVANRYCQMLGYDYAAQQIIAYNVGVTNYILCNSKCVGWRCNGFTKITCVESMVHKPADIFYYRSRRYVMPRYNNYRVDWCYKNGKECGERTANSFCRRMGYNKSTHYKPQEHIDATKAIGNQKLCFGHDCKAFLYIDCYR